MTEALKLRETMNEIKKIYDWEPWNDYEGFIDSVKEREEVFKKYYSITDIKEKYEKLEEEIEGLKELNKIQAEEKDELIHDNQQLKITDSICLQVVDLIGDELPDNGLDDEGDDILSCIKDMKEERDMWRLMAKQRLKKGTNGVWTPAEVALEIEDLKNQIPDKKGKKLSKDDKETLESLLYDVKCLSQAAEADSPLTLSGGFDAKNKLLDRLLT